MAYNLTMTSPPAFDLAHPRSLGPTRVGSGNEAAATMVAEAATNGVCKPAQVSCASCE